MIPGRCPICDWSFAKSRNEGCIPGDCSYRPREGSDEYLRIEQRRAALGHAEITEGPPHEYLERIAICVTEGIPQERAEEIAREQVEANRNVNEQNK